MNKIMDSIKYLKIYDIVSPFLFVISLVLSILLKLYFILFKKNVWLICENGKTARDNGYHFFKYMMENHKDITCYYVIDKKSVDYLKVKDYGNIIQFKSLKHWVFYLASKLNISNHKNGNPAQPLFYVIHVCLKMFNNRVFLQHGITKDDAKWLYYEKTRFKYFVCGAKREYEYIKEKFGYPEDNVIYTGFPRFDNLYDNKVDNKQILVMPTWRNWLGRETNSMAEKIDFAKTDYYKNWSEFLNNKKLIEYLIHKDSYILFYPHIEMQKFIKYFKIRTDRIKILSADDVDIQTLLKESSILITDYSSVYMDFAYMKKPVLYFQFDYETYRNNQYQDGYFDYHKDGFGPVSKTVGDLINNLENIKVKGLDKKYFKRMDNFFELRDRNNSKRLYCALKGVK